ncbi:outer membrane protein assembly factor BamE, partial [Domibacillus sp. PGB-M46]|uniref:outer membrane protein assembly factor BamE n=1 Tax=Domibacillus sp. PGB-M46 TaxID=2910255 RepID=UPI001F5711A9
IAELTTSVDEKDTKIAELTTSVDEKDIKISELMKSIMYHKFLNIRDLSLLKVEDVNRIMGFEGEQREYIYRYEWGTLGNNVRVDFLDNGSGYATSKGYSNITQEGLTILHQDSLDQIDLGMTYEQVANILGAAGTIIESNSNGITRIIWHHNG